MCRGKAERPGKLQVGGKNGRGLVKGEYREGGNVRAAVAAVAGMEDPIAEVRGGLTGLAGSLASLAAEAFREARRLNPAAAEECGAFSIGLADLGLGLGVSSGLHKGGLLRLPFLLAADVVEVVLSMASDEGDGGIEAGEVGAEDAGFLPSLAPPPPDTCCMRQWILNQLDLRP